MPRVRFSPSGREVEVRKGTRLIDAVRAAGLPIARACGDDLVCAKCGVEIRSGSVHREKAVETRTKARNRVPEGLRLACALRVHEDLEVAAPYWGAESAPESPTRGLVIVDHGSRRPEAHAHLEALGRAVAERRPGVAVRIAHMELAEPDLAAAIEAAVADGAREVEILPLFLVPGRHLAQDIPRLVADVRRRFPEVEIRVAAALGADPALAELIARRLSR